MSDDHVLMKRRRLRLKRDWVGALVESKRPIANGCAELPAGTKWRVSRHYRGLEMKSMPCIKCGISLFVTRVSQDSVVYLGHPDDGQADH